MFNASILRTVRHRLEQYLNDTCTIEQATTAADQYGSSVQTWSTTAEDTPCRIIRDASQSGATQQIGSREALRQQYRLIVIIDVNLDVDCRVTDSSGNVYDVVEIEVNLTDSMYKSAIIARRD
ncbi:MAG: hypothetical protein L6Q98_08430 [Anaerolineae bacterium]|nr:hypothetical protein [Anaerolineae bacterium]NUQ02615.1 hypothetical protein [Anaerolineae bacterium]